MNGKLLSQLPDFLCENELVERLKILPNYNINIANETMPTRLQIPAHLTTHSAKS